MTPGPLHGIRHLALDMDGTIYRGKTLFDFTLPFLARMDALGIGCTFLTNNSSKSVADYLKHLAEMGIKAGPNQMYTSALATLDYLREQHPRARRVFLLGTASLAAEFAAAGYEMTSLFDEPDVVVAAFDPDLAFNRLCKAAWWIKAGKPYVATHPDRVCPTDQPTIWIDCGALCACIESATGIRPEAIPGKPDPRMLTGILKRRGLEPDQLAVVGDRTYTDMAMAHRAGAVGVLVLTGESSLEDAAACQPPPQVVVPSLRELGDLLADAASHL